MSTTETPTREDIEEALGHHVHAAKRTFASVGTEKYPTRWDNIHARINELLDQLDGLKAEVA